MTYTSPVGSCTPSLSTSSVNRLIYECYVVANTVEVIGTNERDIHLCEVVVMATEVPRE